jgi:hypothetical protein
LNISSTILSDAWIDDVLGKNLLTTIVQTKSMMMWRSSRAVASRHNRSSSGMSPPLWSHPLSIRVTTWNRQVERKMVVTEALTPPRLWSSSWCSAVDTEPTTGFLMRNPCRYPTDRVPLCTCFKPRQKVRHAPMRCHLPPRHRNPPPCLRRAPTFSRVQCSGPLPFT